jgi:uncharacterized coiled-coil protein SlyX
MTTTARATARKTAQATTKPAADTDQPTPEPDEPAAPVVPPPGEGLPEDELAERVAALEELAAYQAESAARLTEAIEQATAGTASATALLQRLTESMETRHRELVDALTAVSGRVSTLERVDMSAYNARLSTLEHHLSYSTVPPGAGVEPTAAHVHQAIGAVMRDVREIGKNGEHEGRGGGQRFKFRQLDEIMDAIGVAMRTHGLYVRPSVLANKTDRWTTKNSNGRDTTVSSVITTMRYSLVSTVDGSSVDMDMVGEGRDNGDKATSKSVAMAYKYLLLQAFCIPVQDVTGMDVENFEPPTEAPTGRPQAPQYHGNGDGMSRQAAAQQLQQGAQRYAQQATPPAAPINPMEKALSALGAIRKPGLTREKLDAIAEYANELGIMDVQVDGRALSQHLWAVKGILDQEAASRAANAQRQTQGNPPSEGDRDYRTDSPMGDGDLPWGHGDEYAPMGGNSGWPHP